MQYLLMRYNMFKLVYKLNLMLAYITIQHVLKHTDLQNHMMQAQIDLTLWI